MRLASCYVILKTNGTSVFLTNHSNAILFQGDLYAPTAPSQTTATRSEGALKATNTDLEGALTSDEITDADLQAGLYNGATMFEYVVNYLFPHRGPILTERYTIQAVEHDGDEYRCELTGIAGSLETSIGKVFTRPCMARVGDDACKKDLTDFTFAGLTIDTIVNERTFIASDDASLNGLADNYFRWGHVSFTTGLNTLLEMEAIDYDDASRTFTFAFPPPFPLIVADEFTAIAGCDGLKDTCNFKFNHVLDHQGWPFIIGSDRSLKTPTVTS